jgi:hypothetical protein
MPNLHGHMEQLRPDDLEAIMALSTSGQAPGQLFHVKQFGRGADY